MKQVKKLLVILPLVALFVLGSLPVLASNTQFIFRYNGKPATTEKDNEIEKAFDKSLFKVFLPNGTTEAQKDIDYTLAVVHDQEGNAKVTVTNTGDNTTDTLTFKVKAPTPPAEEAAPYTLIVKYYEDKECTKPADEKTRRYSLEEKFFEAVMKDGKMVYSYANVSALAESIKTLVMDQLQNGFKEVPGSFASAAEEFLNDKEGKKTATVKLYLPRAKTLKVIAYDIHHNCFVFDRLFELEMDPGWTSERDASLSFYNHSDSLSADYLYAGFATKTIGPVVVYRATYLETIAKANYLRALDRYDADIVTFVVPRTINIKTYHVFPEGTRDDLIEIIPVPYETWASLQYSSQFMNLPEIFRTRIQKVNEMGFSFREVRYYSGIREITGLLAGYDWNGDLLTADGDGAFCARVFYDKAVAAAKEVPTEKKVDAATAPQAQIKAPAAQAPVTAANTTTTTAPVNTLPVTGASDSIFLFLSSAALMAVGILFFKKH